MIDEPNIATSMSDGEAALSEILHAIHASRENETPVFEAILKNATRLCGAPLASLNLLDDTGERLILRARWGGDLEEMNVDTSGWQVSGPSAPAMAVRETRFIHIEDMAETEGYRRGDPLRVRAVETHGIRSFLAVPLLHEGKAIGCIDLFRREVSPFDDRHIALIETFAAQAVIAIENVRQFRELENLNAELGERVDQQVGEIERIGRLKRFLPVAVADAVVSSGSEEMLQSHRALLGILFCDIRGFTAFCERAEPEETIEVLQTYHEEMGRLISESSASVDHRMGDGIMVLFNDPIPCDDPAGEAIRLALVMQARMAELCKHWKRLGHRLGFGLGVSLGYATVGMVGSEGRQDYTASGTAVNLASRLCDKAEDGEILISPRAHIATEDDFRAEPFGEITLKGIQDPLEVFRVIGPRTSP